MPHRYEYFLDLSIAVPKPRPLDPKFLMKCVSISDADDLAAMMLDAYRGTIDYQGEDIEDARQEILGYFCGKSGGTDLRELSRVISQDDRPISACLSAKSDQRKYPLVAYSMTRNSYKGMGLARYLLATVLHELKSAGHLGVMAVITEGNIPSERLFGSAGFELIDR